MDTDERLLGEVAHDVFSRGHNELDQVWRQCSDLGWSGVGLPETDGGSGGELRQLGIILRELGYAGGSSPLPEFAIGMQILAQVDELSDLFRLALEGGLRVVALPMPIELNSEESLIRCCARVPWGRSAQLFVGTYAGGDEPLILVLRAEEVEVKEGMNLAGEPRDEVIISRRGGLSGATVGARGPLPDVVTLMAFFRSAQIAGALRRSLDLSVGYAKQRVQFGRPIGSFQAVAHSLAKVAGLSEAADAIVEQAYASHLDGEAVAAAKIVTAACARDVVPLAHQIHGAIGVTKEYQLHRVSLRATAWSQEAGTLEDWAARLGVLVSSGPEAWWDRVSSAVAR